MTPGKRVYEDFLADQSDWTRRPQLYVDCGHAEVAVMHVRRHRRKSCNFGYSPIARCDFR
jgi:hypothetical protein